MRILSRYTRSFRTPSREVNVLSRRNHPCNFSVNLKVRPNAKAVQLMVKNNEPHEPPTLLLAMKYSLEVEAASPVSTIASTIATLALPPPPKSVPPTAAKGLLPPVTLM